MHCPSTAENLREDTNTPSSVFMSDVTKNYVHAFNSVALAMNVMWELKASL